MTTTEQTKQTEELPPLVQEEKVETTVEESTEPTQEKKEQKQSKAEKKIRKALSKLNLTPYPHAVSKVSMNQKALIINIENPDIFTAGKNCFVVYGEINIDNAFSKRDEENISNVLNKEETKETAKETTESSTVIEGIDASKYSEEDIKMVMEQGTADRAKAISALHQHNGDVIQAIMTLTESG